MIVAFFFFEAPVLIFTWRDRKPQKITG